MHLFWFVPTFPDQARLGDPDTLVAPSLEHLTRVARAAEDAGFEGMLVPTGEGCLDAWMVASTLAQVTERLRYLVAFRPGFVAPPVAARMASTLDQLSGGRLLLNVVTGGHPHELETDGDVGVDHDARYRRTDEFLEVVLRSWHERRWDHDGEFFSVRGGGIQQQPVQQPHPKIYLGGSSELAMQTAAKYADVYLMWGEPVERMAERAAQAKKLAADLGRTIEVGTRFQIVCRETDDEARRDAEDIVGHIDEGFRERLRAHADRTDSVGQSRQNELWQQSGGDWLTEVLWNGFARARIGASVALVGSGPSIKRALDEYVDGGIDTFILSGYRHDEEAERVGRHLLPLCKISS
ncbi:MAG TPA: LLM class flavin-dependent oxidoreductase [Acidimicrobiales bacterium]|nr:LLM class flavin-dependent oxidoreductase [Acidimicrobiales bacterium]